MPENLWPDFSGEPRLRTVRRVLIEAGEGLAERTEGKIHFEVESKPGGQGRFLHDCYLFVPSILYRYPLFKVVEEGDPYPVTVIGDATFQKGVAAGKERALVENLKLLFHADTTKKMVQQLLDLLS